MINYIRSKIRAYKKRKFYSQFIGKDDLCFDIGANIGTKSIIFLSLGAKVIAAEPQKDCEKSLQKIKESYENFDYGIFGLASETGLKTLYKSNIDELSTFSKSFVEFAGKNENVYYKEQVEVEVFTLDYLIEKHGIPRYCKIDVEGYEMEVLKGLSQRIDYIEFEMIDVLKDQSITCVKYLSGIYANVYFNIFQNESEGLVFKEWYPQNIFIKKLEEISSSIHHANIIARFR